MIQYRINNCVLLGRRNQNTTKTFCRNYHRKENPINMTKTDEDKIDEKWLLENLEYLTNGDVKAQKNTKITILCR